MGLKENELRALVYNLAVTLGSFNINLFNKPASEYTNDELKKVCTGYHTSNLRIHWGIMDNTNTVVYPVAMHTDNFTILLNHYDGIMISKTRSEFILSSKYTGWYIIIENMVEVKNEF